MPQSAKDNFQKVKNLATVYYGLKHGELIKKHLELLFLFKIEKIGHPHDNFEVHISRRSLKHFVERRKEELIKRNSKDGALLKILLLINKLEDIVIDFESYKPDQPFKHFYSKTYSLDSNYILRIILEAKENRLEIISIHLKRK